MRAILIAAVLASLSPVAAQAVQAPRPGATDPRIRTVMYDPDQVVSLRGFFGYQMMLEFAPGERIENVSIGDALAWQVTPNRKANLLFIKPVEAAAPTNMTVVTDQRRYSFEMVARKATGPRQADMAYVVRFLYPLETVAVGVEPPPPPPPERRNTAYTYTGSRAALPSLVFDDGRFTYFQWAEGVSTPALFLLSADGSESIVNYSVRDGFQVVEQLAPRFQLRNGKDVTTVINGAWREPSAGVDAPRPNDAKTARAAAGGRP
ncbi:MAG: TrbG/VirB9 family P-type conjugative transfer protein [Gemmatimonadaceae bacterium]|nr:TrbG/VirB9 family P-type conjugative transfer protein [Caulobacter sp.]